ncbi:MAG TPA: hypothetical protein VNW15_05975 [Rhizomicrobium sp.]|jgi:hypothetical protein|nr:hypothetical protein [Rhizomicrobium sp.]
MSIWEAITGRYKDLPEVTPDEIETLRAAQFQFGQKVDNKIALDLMNKGLMKLARSGYGLTGKGKSVLAANS